MEYTRKININKKNLIKKINIWIPLKFFGVFLWSLKHLKIIKKGEMHPKFYETDKLQGNIDYSKTMFNRCLNAGVIDKRYKNFDIERALK